MSELNLPFLNLLIEDNKIIYKDKFYKNLPDFFNHLNSSEIFLIYLFLEDNLLKTKFENKIKNMVFSINNVIKFLNLLSPTCLKHVHLGNLDKLFNILKDKFNNNINLDLIVLYKYLILYKLNKYSKYSVQGSNSYTKDKPFTNIDTTDIKKYNEKNIIKLLEKVHLNSETIKYLIYNGSTDIKLALLSNIDHVTFGTKKHNYIYYYYFLLGCDKNNKISNKAYKLFIKKSTLPTLKEVKDIFNLVRKYKNTSSLHVKKMCNYVIEEYKDASRFFLKSYGKEKFLLWLLKVIK